MTPSQIKTFAALKKRVIDYFHNQWTHTQTKIGAMPSLEGLDESIPAGANTDADYIIACGIRPASR